MGRRKGSKNKKSRGVSTKRKTVGTSLIGGFAIAVACVLFIFFQFDNIGIIGEATNRALTGLFGITKWGVSIVLLYVGGHAIVSEKKVKIGLEIFQGILAVIFVSSAIYLFGYNRFDLANDVFGFINWSMKHCTSGMIGAVIANAIQYLGGVLVARIIAIACSIFTTFYFFKISIVDFCIGIYNVIATILEFIINLFITLFNKSQERKKIKKEELVKQEKIQKEEIKQTSMETVGSRNYAANIKDDDNQISIDLNDAASKEQVDKAKEQRDEFFKKQRETNEEKNIKEVLQLDHSTHEEENINYVFPPITLLQEAKNSTKTMNKKAVDAVADKLEKTLESFGVTAKVTNITKGPTVICYELTPAVGVKVSKIVNLADDIALNLAAKSIRIEAPIPGKGTVGIEVPNEQKESVYLRDIIENQKFIDGKSKLTFALGKDTAGDIQVGDISKMPHVLVAGATGSGKSVCINTMIVSILYKAKPNEVKLILIDPKMVEMSQYNGIPHLLIPVVTDPKKAAGALTWAVTEMVDRYTKFASRGVKDINGYNKLMEAEEGKKLPQIVIVIDELSDLMMASPQEVEDAICRLAQMARAAGMYLVIATQRPSVDVITGVIKANIPSRIAFTVSSQVDSRTILDMAGAEKLLGKGDMLYYPTGEIKPQRIQGAFISEKEIEDIVTYIKGNSQARYNEDIIEKINKGGKSEKVEDTDNGDADVLLENAIDLVVDMGQASASMIQRRFKVGYARAGRIVDQMETRGIISGYDGSKPRQVLISKDEWQELKFGNGKTGDMQETNTVSQPVVQNVVENNANDGSFYQNVTEEQPVQKSESIYDKMLMDKLKKQINMDSMFYDDEK